MAAMTIAGGAPTRAELRKTRTTREESMIGTALRVIAGAAALLAAGPCFAQAPTAYPTRSVRMIVPFAAGGPTDVIARVVAQKLSETLGQQFYVENLPGAGGNTGTAQAAKAPADGYTLLVVSTGFIVNPSLYVKGVPYDPVKDFAPITLVAASPNVMAINPTVAAKNVQELIGLIKANPGKFSFAQPATGSTPHLNGELFKLQFGLDLVMVPFTGAALAVTSTIAGHTPIAFTALPPAIANIRDGKLRGLAVLSLKRVAALPDVATAAEAGIPGHEGDTLTGIVVPAGTPKAVVEKLNGEIKKLVALPDVKEKLEALGFGPIADTPAEFGARINSEMARWAKVINEAKIKIE
jgi:tripartite-type tricarboxylate transporter receptor subunit TctC